MNPNHGDRPERLGPSPRTDPGSPEPLRACSWYENAPPGSGLQTVSAAMFASPNVSRSLCPLVGVLGPAWGLPGHPVSRQRPELPSRNV